MSRVMHAASLFAVVTFWFPGSPAAPALQDEKPPAPASTPASAPADGAESTPAAATAPAAGPTAPAGPAAPPARGAAPMLQKKDRDALYKKVRELLEAKEEQEKAKQDSGDPAKTKKAEKRSATAREDLNKALKAYGTQYKVDPECVTPIADWLMMFSDYATEKGKYTKTGKQLGSVKEDTAKTIGTRDTVRYAVRVPKAYAPEKKAWPLVIVIPDKVKEKEGEKSKSAKNTINEDLKSPVLYDGDAADPGGSIVLAIEVPEKSWANQKDLNEAVFLPLRDTRLIYRIDPNKISILGLGGGAAGAARIAASAPFYFSALAARGGEPGDAKPENLSSIPCFLAAEKGPWEAWIAKHTEAGGESQVSSGASVDETASWMAKQTRNPFRDHLVYRPDVDNRRAGTWLFVDIDPTKDAKIDARIDRATNTIDVTSEGIVAFNVALCDALLDLSKPVTIRTNGGDPYVGKLAPSLAVLLQSADKYGGIDLGWGYSAIHRIEVRAKKKTEGVNGDKPDKKE